MVLAPSDKRLQGVTMTRIATKANTGSAMKRRILATVLAMAAAEGHGDAHGADCIVCGRYATVGLGASDPKRFELGHMVPDTMGGAYSTENLRPMCRRCNAWLGDRDALSVFTPRYSVSVLPLVADPGPRTMDDSPVPDFLPPMTA